VWVASHLETATKQLSLLEDISAIFSNRVLKSLNNQAGFDSAIRILIHWPKRPIKLLGSLRTEGRQARLENAANSRHTPA
jgi:hypothetical protein